MVVETRAECVSHYLGCIEASRQLIIALEAKAKQFPTLADDIGDAIACEKETIRYYQGQML